MSPFLFVPFNQETNRQGYLRLKIGVVMRIVINNLLHFSQVNLRVEQYGYFSSSVY